MQSPLLILFSVGVDVNIYASSSKDAWPLVGNHENTEIGDFLAAYLDVDVPAVTKKLQASQLSMGDRLGADIRVDQLDSYHGDFRKRDIEERSCDCGYH
jgi:alkaline phosphatase